MIDVQTAFWAGFVYFGPIVVQKTSRLALKDVSDIISRSEKVNKEDDAVFVIKRYNYLNSSGTFK